MGWATLGRGRPVLTHGGGKKNVDVLIGLKLFVVGVA